MDRMNKKDLINLISQRSKDLNFAICDLYRLLENLELEYKFEIDMNDIIVEKYPFDKDYLEVISEIFFWTESIREKLEELKK